LISAAHFCGRQAASGNRGGFFLGKIHLRQKKISLLPQGIAGFFRRACQFSVYNLFTSARVSPVARRNANRPNQMTTISTAASKQTFPLIVGEEYRVTPPINRRLGVIYISGICKLIEVKANGKARFKSQLGNIMTVSLTDNRIFKF